jgi:hypothetical protein
MNLISIRQVKKKLITKPTFGRTMTRVLNRMPVLRMTITMQVVLFGHVVKRKETLRSVNRQNIKPKSMLWVD